jgi:nicotinate-nucleotide adenylyltransferase
VKIACFGGSFNPVHIGHVKLVEAIYRAGYEKIIVIPAYHSPFKEAFSEVSDNDRLFMLELAFKNHPYVEIEKCEIERGGISYTIDTMRFLEEKLKNQGLDFEKLSLVIGSDLISSFYKWKDAEKLVNLVDILLAKRPLENINFEELHFPYPHKEINNDLYDISSSMVRKRIQNQESVVELLPEEVLKYINARRLYCE